MYNSQPTPPPFYSAERVADASYVSRIMKRVYLKMFLAMIVTAVTSFVCMNVPAVFVTLMSNSGLYFGLLIAEVVLVFVLAGALNKLSSPVASLIFYVYSILNGVVLSAILAAYTASSVFSTFVITAAVFGTMTVYGYVTKSDLSRVGTFLFMALIGLIICTIVNIFMKSSTMEWIISFAGVVIFIGLTAWDTQKIKQMAAMTDGSQAGKLATIGALSLYLDFVNLFLYLLRFFGNRE